MIDRYGYFTGAAIACATVALAIYSGILYERHTAPNPCITNLSIHSYPQFGFEQMMIDTIIHYNKDSDFYRTGIKTSEEMAEHLVEMSQDSDYPSSIYTNQTSGRKFYVPALCYVGKIDVFGDPILYKK
jgi:hypothetical protein